MTLPGRRPDVCPSCGRPLDAHDRHVRFKLPDPVLAVPAAERADRSWGNDVLLQVQGVGAFVRVLLPIHMTGGYTITVGTWLGVHPHDLRRAWKVWWRPEYAELQLDGHLANALPPWGEVLVAKPATATVQHPDEVPYVTGSSDQLVERILRSEWPHEQILAALDV
jgi:hypothetical protein